MFLTDLDFLIIIWNIYDYNIILVGFLLVILTLLHNKEKRSDVVM